MVRIIIAGGRTFDNYPALSNFCWDALKKIGVNNPSSENVTILSGGAKGADGLGEKFARENRLNLELFSADWKTYGRAAGPIRNKQMLEEGRADYLFAFWDGKSAGTKNMIDHAKGELGHQKVLVKRY
jgi:hypothetical protein